MNLRIISLCFLFVNSAHANPDEFENLYSQLLISYWRPAITINGVSTTVFDYVQMKKDADQPKSLFTQTLNALEEVNPLQFKSKREKAFWINAYNFAAMHLVIEHYPVDSIRSLRISLIKYPWSKKAILIGGNEYSLKQIEKDILLEKFGDPRIIFAISCAAVSCPDRIAEPITSEKIDYQLDKIISNFFANSDKGLLLNRSDKTIKLSWILKKDMVLFEDTKSGVLDFITPYLSTEAQVWLNENSVSIEYFEHDWTLNDLAQADTRTENE